MPEYKYNGLLYKIGRFDRPYYLNSNNEWVRSTLSKKELLAYGKSIVADSINPSLITTG